MKAFLSYKFKDNVSAIISLLKERNIEVLDSMSDLKTGNSLQQSIKNGILDCDIVILVYTSENPNIAFEAGIAVARNKPIFSIVAELNNDPDFLYDSAYVHAYPTEIDKIKFNLNIFLDKIKPKKKHLTPHIKSHKFYGNEFPNFYSVIHKNYLNINRESEKSYEYFFKDIFEKYQLSVIQNKFDFDSNFYADFCIWSDKLSSVIGNPILIEIKKELNSQNIKKIQENIHNLISQNSAESCLVFYDYLKGLDKNKLPNTSKYLFIQISDFVDKLNENDFNGTIRKIRNEVVHNYK